MIRIGCGCNVGPAVFVLKLSNGVPWYVCVHIHDLHTHLFKPLESVHMSLVQSS